MYGARLPSVKQGNVLSRLLAALVLVLLRYTPATHAEVIADIQSLL